MNSINFEELRDKIIEAWKPIQKQLEELAESISKAIEEANRKIEQRKKSQVKPVQFYNKCNRTDSIICCTNYIRRARSNI